MWAINRLAQKRPELLLEWTAPILAQLNSPDMVKKGLALRTLLLLLNAHAGGLVLDPDATRLALLIQNQTQIRLFQDGSFEVYTIGRLASELLERLTQRAGLSAED